MTTQRPMLGELLVQGGYLTVEQVQAAITESSQTNRRLGEVLVARGDISSEALINFLQIQLGHPVVGLAQTHIDTALARTLPERFCRGNGVLPLYRVGEKVVVAMLDPTDLVVADQLRLSMGSEIEVMAARPDDLENAFHRVFSGTTLSSTMPTIEGPGFGPAPFPAQPEKKERLLPVTEGDAGFTSLAQILDHMFREALKIGASSIHLEPKVRHLAVRYRISGLFHAATSIPKDLQGQVLARIKTLAKMDPNEKVRGMEEGRFHIRTDAASPPIDCRVSVVPVLHGENIVIRMVKRDEVIRPLGGLGLEPDQEAILRGTLARRRGLVLVSGPTDSGKTATVYSLLGTLIHPSIGIVTIEDPIEYPVTSFNQLQLPPSDATGWDLVYRSIIRQEPHCISISSIRDPKTAWMAVRAASTGRLVLTTLYADDAVTAHWVLFQQGADPHAVASVLDVSIAVRLLRKVCPSCREESAPSDALLAELGLGRAWVQGKRFSHGAGCSHCNATGYKDRVAVFEVMPGLPHLLEMISSRTSSEVMKKAAMDSGMRTLREVALSKAERGETSLEECARVL